MARIIIVDDALEIRLLLKELLEKAGHEVVASASNGKMAYMEYKKHLPDLVTMDVTMPGTDGIKVAEEIIKEFPDARIVMVSATMQSEIIFNALLNGIIKNYIIKPISKEKLLDVIDTVLCE